MRNLLLALVLCCIPVGMASQELPKARTALKTYGVEAGLDNLAIWSIMQDHQGFIWMASEGGVARYDGQRFQNFGMEHGLPSGDILTLHQDPAGTIWVGTYLGLARWADGRFITSDDVPAGLVETIQTGPEGRVWVTTPAGPYAQGPGGRFAPLPGWPGGEATALWAAPALGKVWVASSRSVEGRSETQVFEHHQGGWQSVPFDPGLRGIRIDALAGDRKGRLWARSASRLWALAPGQGTFQAVLTPPLVAGSRGFLSIDRKGNLWVPTNRNLLSLEGDAWQVMDEARGFPAFTRGIMEDREGNLWISGVGAFRRLGRGVLSSYTIAEGLPSNIIWTILRDRANRLWVGTDRGACRAHQGTWEVIPGTEQFVTRCFAEDRKGRIYMAGNTQEILRYDPRIRRLERFPVDVGRPTKRIFRLWMDGQDRLWVGTEAAGLITAACADEELRFRPVDLPDGHPTERFAHVLQDAAGRVWACGSQGVAMLERGQWRRFTARDGLRETHVSYARTTPAGDLLVAYFNRGMSRVRYENGRLVVLQNLDKEDGLAASKVYIMGEDGKGRLWIGTGRGVDVLSRDGVEHFGSADGLPSDDCNTMAFLADPGGDIWIGTSGGLARFQMEKYQGLPSPPTAAVVSVMAGKRPLRSSTLESVPISYQDNTVEFRFAGLSFLSEGQLEHQIRLVGLETEWHTTFSREARYPGLAQGSYRFEMRARLGRGPWSPPVTYPFTILAPWWQRWWFYLACVLLAGGGALVVIRARIASLRRHNRELEAMVLARTHQLKEANEALRDQSLTDPLTGLRNRRFLGESIPDDVALVNRTHRNMLGVRRERIADNIDLLFLMVDIDHFKTINDEHGHHAGDLVLQQVAEVLRHATRESDTVVRWGGEEFLLVARNSCRKDSAVMAERVRAGVEGHLFDLGDGVTLHRTCSVGFASYPLASTVPDLFNWEQVVDLADQCLYAAKRGGRNAWVGITGADDARLTSFERTGYVSVGALVAHGAVTITTSILDGQELEWKQHAHEE